ncbi:MAG: YfhO family protein [Candidatus Levybacteria bacterium]|nr:YfhO family protein [Candidatus Levybacteria bacterium]
MKANRNYLWVFILFILITLFFFYKSLLNGYIPFPGDLLVGEYAPYNSYPFLGYAPSGYPNKGQDFDVLRLLYPEKEFSISIFKNLELPFWNPYNFSGNPHIASLQSGSFYPFNLIFFFLPFVYGWTVFIILQPILSTIFTFLFARELSLSTRSSIFSSLVFTFSSYSIVWMEYGNIGHSILWMPFVLFLFIKNLKNPSILKSVLISLSLTFSILAGYIQTAFYVYIFVTAFVLFYTFFIDKMDRIKKLSISCLVIVSSVLLSAVQLLPMFELIFQSARIPYSQPEFLKLLIPSFHAITMFVPDFFGNPSTRNYWINGTYIERVSYIGVVPLIFIFISFFRKQYAYFWFFAVSAVVILLLSFDTYLARTIYFFQIPFVSTAVPTRIMFLFCFSASILSGFGLDAFLREQNKKIFLRAIYILCGIYILTWLFVFISPTLWKDSTWISNLQISKRNLILPTGIFLVSAFVLLINFHIGKHRKFAIIFLLSLSVFDLFYFFHKITPFAPKETIYLDTEVLRALKEIQGINRSWGYGSGYISTNLQTHEKIFSTDGYNALHIRRYGELLASSKDGKIPSLIPRSDPMIASGYGLGNLRENKYRQRLLNLLGVKYVLNKIENKAEPAQDYQIFDDETYSLIWQEFPWQIYENKKALPRIFFSSDYVVESDKNRIIQMIHDDGFNPREKIILEESILPKVDLSDDKNAKIVVEKYTPNKVILETDAKTNMILFLSDNYYSGWTVSIDGEDDKIYKADYSFRAVPVKKGNHEVIFSYYPESFDLGIKVSLITFGSLILLVFVKRFKINVQK